MALAIVPLLHVPLPSLKVGVDPAQTINVPVIAPGKEFTVTVVEVVQPVPKV